MNASIIIIQIIFAIQFHVKIKYFFKYVAQTHKFKSGNAVMHFPFPPLLDVTHIQMVIDRKDGIAMRILLL